MTATEQAEAENFALEEENRRLEARVEELESQLATATKYPPPPEVDVVLIASGVIERDDCAIFMVRNLRGTQTVVVIEDERFEEYQKHPERFVEGRSLVLTRNTAKDRKGQWGIRVRTVPLPMVDYRANAWGDDEAEE